MSLCAYDVAFLPAMAALARLNPQENLHAIDLPWRFSSWAFDDPANIGLWLGPSGELLAWAVMQAPFWTIDYALHPEVDSGLRRSVWEWASRRADELLGTPHGRPSWFVSVLRHQTTLRQELQASGFACQADVPVDPWSQVLLALPTETPLPQALTPSRFVLRPLGGVREIEPYVALHQAVFQSRTMSTGWRGRTLQQPEYRSDLDLVAVAPDGQLAAFCVAWLALDGQAGQIEPLGVAEAYRGQGLGRAILIEAVRRLRAHGARTVYVETDSFRDSAVGLYGAVGFRVLEEVLIYRRDFQLEQ